ncbi:MAG: RNA polymerase sigma factor [Bacteroidales bacterium]|nr:RNA polymerase sigma factor [Bacteroidales bacterium]
MNSTQFNDIVDNHSDNVYRFIYKSIKNQDDAKDVVQEAFSRLWKNKDSVDPEKAKSYLFSTAYHVMIDDIRKRKREKIIDEYETNKHFHNEQYSDLKEVLNKAIDTLPDIQKNVILLRDYEGYSYKEIGDITNLSESQVKVYIFRARKALKDLIGKMENVI